MFDFMASKKAFGIYLIILFILVIILALSVVAALIIVQKKADEGKENKKKKKATYKGTRFSMLNKIDKDMSSYVAPRDSDINLKEFCDNFRNFAAAKLGLYYDIEDIRRFVAAMGVTKLIIIKGMSGTGKTSLAYAFGQFVANDSVIVPVQPMWKERSDLVGYFNEFTGKFNETSLLRKMYEAGYSKEIYITVLDEMNISRIEYYFAEFLSLLEIPDQNKRYLDVVSDCWTGDPKRLNEGKLLLPVNMWFVGTANNDDSTFAISDKVYDRSMVINLEKRAQPFDAQTKDSEKISYDRFTNLILDAKSTFPMPASSYEKVRKLDEYLQNTFKISFGNRIMKQIEDYIPVMIACGGSENEAIDDIVSKKILRKLEQLNPSYVKSCINPLCSYINEVFGQGSMPQSISYLMSGVFYGK